MLKQCLYRTFPHFSGDSRTPHQLENFYMVVDAEHKLGTLITILREKVALGEKVMVFFSTCAMVEYFTVAIKRCVMTESVAPSSWLLAA